MKDYPVNPTIYNPLPENKFKWEWYERDFFHSKDGTKEFPEHHCKLTWKASIPFIKSFRNAIDIGCRDGEYTRYLHHDFQHVFCFDYRKRKLFQRNVDLSKVTHFKCGLGEKEQILKVSGGGSMFSEGKRKKENWVPTHIFTLDQFNLQNIDYIKIDVDGFEVRVLQGAKNTILKNKPLLVIEAENGDTSGINYIEQTFNYEIAAWDSLNRNVVMQEKK